MSVSLALDMVLGPVYAKECADQIEDQGLRFEDYDCSAWKVVLRMTMDKK